MIIRTKYEKKLQVQPSALVVVGWLVYDTGTERQIFVERGVYIATGVEHVTIHMNPPNHALQEMRYAPA